MASSGVTPSNLYTLTPSNLSDTPNPPNPHTAMLSTPTLTLASTFLHITPTSDNAKTGPILVTTTTSLTCPDACPFKRTVDGVNGCYADGGPLAMHWRQVTLGRRGKPWVNALAQLAAELRRKGRGATWRHNQAGDLPGQGDVIDAAGLADLVKVNADASAHGFTYTHKPLVGSAHASANLAAVQAANAGGFTVNASANTLAHADALAELGGVPVVVVVAHDAPDTLATPAGRKVVVCPAQRRDDVTCSTCRLCSRAERSVIVAFRAHGASYRRAEAATVSA